MPKRNITHMKISVSFCSVIILLFIWGCTNKQKALNNKIEALEESFKKNMGPKIYHAKVNELLKLYEQYAADYKDDSLTVRYIYETANLYMGMNNTDKAMECCNKIIDQYPKSNMVAGAYFFKAFICDEKLKDYECAKAAYKEVFTKFPQSEFAHDSRILYERAGRPVEEWISSMAHNDTIVPTEIVK